MKTKTLLWGVLLCGLCAWATLGCVESPEPLPPTFSISSVRLNGDTVSTSLVSGVSATVKFEIAFSSSVRAEDVSKHTQLIALIGGTPLPFSVQQASANAVFIVPDRLQTWGAYQLLISTSLLATNQKQRLAKAFSLHMRTQEKSREAGLAIRYDQDTFVALGSSLVVPLIAGENIAALTLEFVLPHGAKLYDVAKGEYVLMGSGTISNVNLSSPRTYKVVAEDELTIIEYKISGVFGISNRKRIVGFKFAKNLNPALRYYDALGTIQGDTITVKVPIGVNLSQLTPSIDYAGIGISPQTNVKQDFSRPVQYGVTAENYSIQNYIVVVSNESLDHYAVSIDPHNGKEVEVKRLALNEPLPEPTVPERYGYVFGGWYVNEDAPMPVDFGVAFNQDVAIFAKWIPLYEVFFDARGGSLVKSDTLVEGGFLTPPTHPSKKEFHFAGWYTDTLLTTAFDFEHTPIWRNIKLYAKWVPVEGFIQSFVFKKANNPKMALLDEDRTDLIATIDDQQGTIRIELSAYQYANELVPTIETAENVTIHISHAHQVHSETNVAINFNLPITYTFVKPDGSSKDYTVIIKKSPYAHIPDMYFRNALKANPLLVFKGDALEVASALQVQSLNVSSRYEDGKIASLKGIEFFEHLQLLDASYNLLTKVNLSKNKQLTSLKLGSNLLVSLETTSQGLLSFLDCSYNQLMNLDVAQNALLETLYCEYNQLSDLFVHPKSPLVEVNCMYNHLYSVHIPERSRLKKLACNNNLLSELNLSASPQLEWLNCGNNQLTTLNILGTQRLRRLYCNDNQLDSIHFATNLALEEVFCNDNALRNIDLSQCTELVALRCYNNTPLTTIDIRKSQKIRSFITYVSRGKDNQLQYMHLPKNQECSGSIIYDIWNRYEGFRKGEQVYVFYDDLGEILYGATGYVHYNACTR